jgi:hypothetical protein
MLMLGWDWGLGLMLIMSYTHLMLLSTTIATTIATTAAGATATVAAAVATATVILPE